MLPRRPGGDEGVVDNEAKTFEEGRGGGVLQVVSQICRVCVLAPTCLREAIYSRQGCVCDGSNRGGRRGIEARGGKRDANVTSELSLTPG